MPKFHVIYTVAREQIYSFTVSAKDNDSAEKKAQAKIDEAQMKNKCIGNLDSDETEIGDIEVEEL